LGASYANAYNIQRTLILSLSVLSLS